MKNKDNILVFSLQPVENLAGLGRLQYDDLGSPFEEHIIEELTGSFCRESVAPLALGATPDHKNIRFLLQEESPVAVVEIVLLIHEPKCPIGEDHHIEKENGDPLVYRQTILVVDDIIPTVPEEKVGLDAQADYQDG
jgi:hypothetical protein